MRLTPKNMILLTAGIGVPLALAIAGFHWLGEDALWIAVFLVAMFILTGILYASSQSIRKKDIFGILVVGMILLLSSIVSINMEIQLLEFPLILASIFILAAVVETFRRTTRANQLLAESIRRKTQKISDNQFKQNEALLALYHCIKPNFPLPETRDWAASPDLLKLLMETVYREKPKYILEAGSGISTLVLAYCLKQTGKGKIISLEHDEKHAQTNTEMIAAHGLQDVTQIVHAPLKEYEINEKKWLWYDLDKTKLDKPIDLLLIDGPPYITQKQARYPALPLLFDKLAEQPKIILDDGARDDEQDTVERWRKEFKTIRYKFLDLEKGAFVIDKA